jgi:hypothetical protein
MNCTNTKKRKRTKLECLACGSIFDDDYRKKHETKQHEGKRVSVKHVGAPENPFIAAARLKQVTESVSVNFFHCKKKSLRCFV